MKKILLLLCIGLLLSNKSNACTNFMITKGASTEGSNMVTYLADAHVLYGELYFNAAADHPKGAMLDVREWDTYKLLGKIKQVPHTYQTIGNMNEHQLIIAESTYGGRSELRDTTAIMDYGSLIYITLQRSKTAREAIAVIDDLMQTYGYYSSGESFSIADKNEVWYMELISKGMYEKGAVWVARKVPDGYVTAHANQARITQFPLDDPENCLYAKDVISFAKKRGWYKGKDEDFSFSDTYAPVDFGGARFCEARVWAFFNRVTQNMNQHVDYALGKVQYDKQGYATNRLPLWVKPDNKLSPKNVMDLQRDHYEGTPLDMSKDPGSGAFGNPYRWRPLTWEVDSVKYCNERAISTQQTGFSFVAEARSQYPDAVGGRLWFGVDDTYSTCYTPIYSASTRVPECFRVGNGDMLNFSETSAFWTFNTVSNLAYLRYQYIIKDIQKLQNKLENSYVERVKEIDIKALAQYKKNPDTAIEYLTKFSVDNAQSMTQSWKELRNFLIVKYLDGNIKVEENGRFKTNGNGSNIPASPDQPGYSKSFYRKIVEDTGEHLKMIKSDNAH